MVRHPLAHWQIDCIRTLLPVQESFAVFFLEFLSPIQDGSVSYYIQTKASLFFIASKDLVITTQSFALEHLNVFLKPVPFFLQQIPAPATSSNSPVDRSTRNTKS